MPFSEMVEYAEIPRQAWRRLAKAAGDPGHPMRLLTVATIDGDQPDARILVLRGANRDLRCLWFHTDRRSRKIDQISRCPRVVAVGYDHRDGVQLRVQGQACVRCDDDVADRHWEQTELAARYAYALTSRPGQTIAHPDPRMREQRAQLSTIEQETGRNNFAVVEVVVAAIEWLQVGELGDCRAVMRADAEFRAEPLVP